MNIILGKNSGFCNGVKYTLKETEKILKENNKVYCLGEIVHNEEVIDNLTKKGLIFKDDINDIPDNETVIFRAHGVSPEIYEIARQKNLKVYDLTCGKIRIIHNQVKEIKDSLIILIAKKNHPETIGTYGYNDNIFIVENNEDIEKCYNEYRDIKKIYVISQTTFSTKKFDELLTIIKNKFINTKITINKSICPSTTDRQNEVIELSKKVDIMLIIGGKNSSNTKELYNLATKYCKNTYHIQNEKDITFNIDKNATIGIMAGASTNIETVNRVIEKLDRL